MTVKHILHYFCMVYYCNQLTEILLFKKFMISIYLFTNFNLPQTLTQSYSNFISMSEKFILNRDYLSILV